MESCGLRHHAARLRFSRFPSLLPGWMIFVNFCCGGSAGNLFEFEDDANCARVIFDTLIYSSSLSSSMILSNFSDRGTDSMIMASIGV